MKILAAILEDDPVFAELLKESILKLAPKHQLEFSLHIFSSPEELELEDNRTSFALLFLDINLAQHDGIYWMHKWKTAGRFGSLIYVSAYSRMVFRALETEPLAFVRKEYLLKELDQALAVYKRKQKASQIRVAVPEGQKIHFFYPEDIVFLQSRGHYIEVHRREGEMSVIRGKMEEMERIFGGSGFIRPHISYLLNVHYIESVSGSEISLGALGTYKISGKYKDRVIKQIKQYLLGGETGHG